MPEGKIIIKAFLRITDQKEGDPVLLFKQSHELHLMGVDILQCKSLLSALLGVKTYRDSLDHAYIVNSALLVKICKCDMSVLAVDLHRGDGCRHLLNEREILFFIFFICPVDLVFKERTPESS